MGTIKRNSTWSKLKFKIQKKLSDDEDPLSDGSKKKKLKKQRKKWMKNKKKKIDSNEKLKDRGKAKSHEAVPNGCADGNVVNGLLKDRNADTHKIVVAISP